MADPFVDTGFGDFGTDWWNVPADYFTGGGLPDPGSLNTDFGNLGGVPPTTGYGDFYTDPGNMLPSGEDQWFYDTQTGQVVTGPQAQEIDPSFDWKNAAKLAIGGATALGGLGAAGVGLASLFGGNDKANQTTTQTSTGARAPMTPEMQSLLGSTGGLVGSSSGGPPGAPGGGGTGLLGLSNTMIQNLMGPGQDGAPGSLQPQQQPVGQPIGQQLGGGSPDPALRGVKDPIVGDWGPGGSNFDPNGGGQSQSPFQLGAPRQMPGYPPAPQGSPLGGNWTGYPGVASLGGAPQQNVPAGYGMRETTGIQGQKMPPTLQQMGGGQAGSQGMPQPGGQPSGTPYSGTSGQGLIGQQSNVLGNLGSQIPQLNPAIMQALGMQAQGMSQGYLPSLNDPQAQARIQGIYQPGFDALNYNSGLALSNAREQLQQRGFQAPDIREGPTQALTAPILAAQQLGRSQLYGQMAGAQLDLASRLPMLGSQLNAQNYNTQMQPFNAGLNLAGAYNQPIQTQGQFPLSLLDILQRGQGTTQTVNTVGPQPSLTQQLGQVAPLLGAGGNLLSSAGNMFWPQQQQQPQVGLSGVMPQYYSSGGMYP